MTRFTTRRRQYLDRRFAEETFKYGHDKKRLNKKRNKRKRVRTIANDVMESYVDDTVAAGTPSQLTMVKVILTMMVMEVERIRVENRDHCRAATCSRTER